MKAPLIGISASWAPYEKGRGELPDPCFDYLKCEYIDAVARAGGAPIIIPNLLKEHFDILDDILPRLDGLLLSGGSDLDPKYFGQESIPEARCIIRERRDTFEIELLKRFDEICPKKPVLAICRGHQVLNVHLGGTLFQDYDACGCETIPQKHARKGGRTCHEIEVFSGTLLSEIIGEGEHCVNSSHHQGIDELGKGLIVSARAPDRVIEAVELIDRSRWLLSVQWHPEAMHDEPSRKIFSAFVESAKMAMP